MERTCMEGLFFPSHAQKNVWWVVETSIVFLLFLQLYVEPPYSSIEESIKSTLKFNTF